MRAPHDPHASSTFEGPVSLALVIDSTCRRAHTFPRSNAPGMTKGRNAAMWRKPKIVEIAVGMEINSYACAEIS